VIRVGIGLTNSIEESPRKADSRAGNRKICRLLWDPRVHYHVDKSSPLDRILRQMNAIVRSSHVCHACFISCLSSSVILPTLTIGHLMEITNMERFITPLPSSARCLLCLSTTYSFHVQSVTEIFFISVLTVVLNQKFVLFGG
jgi:hypothetical protein